MPERNGTEQKDGNGEAPGGTPTVADFLVQRLREWGVQRIFGYAGDGINPIMGALHRAENQPELIQPTHEELAALMACAHAKYTGEVGVCLATQGPGAIHLLNGLYDAALDHQPVVATAGDGALQMSGLGALIDVARAWQRWQDPRLIVLILNIRELNYVTWEQRVMEGEPKFPVSQDIPDFPCARYAELLGLRGIRVDSPDGVAAAWDEALAADRPVVFEAVTDPDVPTVPPRLKPEQEQKLRQALSQGDPAAAGVLRQARAEGVLGE